MVTGNSNNDNNITVTEVKSVLASSKKCSEKLSRASRQLPKVDEDGHSECPFAEELYAQKEEAQKKAQQCIEQLDECQNWVKEELARCRKNLSIVISGREKLHTESAVNRLSEAEVKLLDMYKTLNQLLPEVEQSFKQLQGTIKEASQKQYPGKIPQK